MLQMDTLTHSKIQGNADAKKKAIDSFVSPNLLFVDSSRPPQQPHTPQNVMSRWLIEALTANLAKEFPLSCKTATWHAACEALAGGVNGDVPSYVTLMPGPQRTVAIFPSAFGQEDSHEVTVAAWILRHARVVRDRVVGGLASSQVGHRVDLYVAVIDSERRAHWVAVSPLC